MTRPIDSSVIEQLVGAERHATKHYGRAVSDEQTVYILHPYACLDTGRDPRECRYSLALDKGIEVARWIEDETVILHIDAEGRLVGNARVRP